MRLQTMSRVGSICAVIAMLSVALVAQDEGWRSLLGQQQITKDIALTKVQEAKGTILVQLDGPVTCPFRNLLPKKLSDMKVQVWLLQFDGTVLTQNETPQHTGWGNGGCFENAAQFYFHANSIDPVAVVISIDGNLSMHQIPQ